MVWWFPVVTRLLSIDLLVGMRGRGVLVGTFVLRSVLRSHVRVCARRCACMCVCFVCACLVHVRVWCMRVSACVSVSYTHLTLPTKA